MSSLLNKFPVRSLHNVVGPSVESQPKEREINVFELTLLLKVMGFRLNHLDYEETASGTLSSPTDLTVEIRCGRQGIVSRLSASAEFCSCAPKQDKTDNDASFWEILGTAPSSSPGGKKKIEDTSSNLLPELSQRGVSNTKQLLNLIFEGFHKDHLPSTTTNSPEASLGATRNPIYTSTQIKSPRRMIPILNSDMLVYDDILTEKCCSTVMAAPPNTPRLGVAGEPGMLNYAQNTPHRNHTVYLEVMAAKERLEKALLALKSNIAGELSNLHGPALDLSSNRVFEEIELSEGTSQAMFKRRSSMGAFPNIRSKADVADTKKKGLVRNKSSIDAGAALKAKTASVTSRYLLPKKPVEIKSSPLGKKLPPFGPTKSTTSKRPPTSAAKAK